MAFRVLIITSQYTGYGHQSITEALCEQFSGFENVSIDVVDGFALAGQTGLRHAQCYGPVTRQMSIIWSLYWAFQEQFHWVVRRYAAHFIREGLVEKLHNYQPNLIVSLHSGFVGSVIDILEEQNLDIPLVTLIVDVVTITKLWADQRVYSLLCPSQSALEKCIEFGMPKNKLQLCDFPVRQRFINGFQEKNTIGKDVNEITFLVMSGGEGSSRMENTARVLLENFPGRVMVVTGRNTFLKEGLEQGLQKKYPSRIIVYGFVDNIDQIMKTSDFVVVRGSPNTVIEAATMGVPVIITGALGGQETGNPEYFAKLGIARICKEVSQLPVVIKDLMANDGYKLKEMWKHQKEFRNPQASRDIAGFVLQILEQQSRIRTSLGDGKIIRRG